MWELAWNNIVRAPARFAASVAAIAISVMLVLVGCGLYVGLLDGIVSYLNSLPGELVVMEQGTSVSMRHFASQLSPEAVEQVEAVDGVQGIEPLFGRPVLFEFDDREALVYAIGLYRNETFGGPVDLLEGERRPRLDQIVIDRVLAHDMELEMGDTVRKGSIALRVAGISSGGNGVIGTYAFVHRGDLMLAGVTRPSYLFVQTDSPELVAAQIDAIPGLKALPREMFLEGNRGTARRILLPVITLLIGIGVVVSAVVVALALYTATVERREEFGLLDAIGIPSARRYGIVFVQSGLATVAGLTLGLALGHVVATTFVEFEPRFMVRLPSHLVSIVAIGTIGVGLVASLLPVRLLTRIDPGMVFRV